MQTGFPGSPTDLQRYPLTWEQTLNLLGCGDTESLTWACQCINIFFQTDHSIPEQNQAELEDTEDPPTEIAQTTVKKLAHDQKKQLLETITLEALKLLDNPAEEAQLWALDFISKLVVNKEDLYQPSIAAASDPTIINRVAEMLLKTNSTKTTEHTLFTLYCLMLSTPNITVVSEALLGGSPLIKLLESSRYSDDVIELACLCLGSLVNNIEFHRSHMRVLLSLLRHKNANIVTRTCRVLSKLTSEATEHNPRNLAKYRKWIAVDGGLESLRALFRESSDFLVENVVYCLSHLLPYLNPNQKTDAMEVEVKQEFPTREPPIRNTPKLLQELCILLAHRSSNVVAAVCWITLQLQQEEKTRQMIFHFALKQFLALLRIEGTDDVTLGVTSNLGPLCSIPGAQPYIMEHLRFVTALLHHHNPQIVLQASRILLMLATCAKATADANRRAIGETPNLLKHVICILWSNRAEDQETVATNCSLLSHLFKNRSVILHILDPRNGLESRTKEILFKLSKSEGNQSVAGHAKSCLLSIQKVTQLDKMVGTHL